MAAPPLPRYSLDDELASSYRADGYVVVTDLFTCDELAAAKAEILALFARAAGGAAAVDDGALVSFADEHPETFRTAARRMWDLLAVFRLGASARVERLLRTLGLEAPIVSTRPEVRTDFPGDARYAQPWHQDWRYGQGSLNAVTLWTPLVDATVENGTIDVMPGSHVLGYLEVEELSNPRRFSILPERLPDLPALPAELAFGETIVFSQLLVHRSGFNSSALPRISVQLRFTDAAEPRFAAAGLPAPDGSELLWDEPPSEAELRALFAAPPTAPAHP